MLNLKLEENRMPERGWWLKEPGSDRKAFGMVLHQVEEKWKVARTLIGSPAEKAGVTKGEWFMSVDDYNLGAGRGEMYELHLLMRLDTSVSHRVTFRTESGDVSRVIQKAALRQLLEIDYDNGGRDYCYGCHTCTEWTYGESVCRMGGACFNDCSIG